MSIFRLIIVAGMIFGAWSTLPSHVSAQSPTKSLNQAMRDGDVEEMGAPFAVSNKDTQSMNIRYRTLRNTAASASGPSIVNWPRRADGCATPYATSSQLKTLPTIPDSGVDRDKQPENLHEYTSGNWRAWSGECRYYLLSRNSTAAELLFDAGTSVTAPWSGIPGFSISPTAYGGWAMPSATPTSLSNSTETRRSTWIERSASCGWNPDLTIFSGWLDPDDGPASGTDPWVTAPLKYNPMHPTASPIWSEPCKNNFDLWDEIYRDNGYTWAQTSNASEYYHYRQNRWTTIGNMMNSGVSLFRQTFTLTQEDIDAIKVAETRNGGLGLDIVADDWYTAYFNGDYMSGSTYTIGENRYTRLPSSLLKVGTNVLGVEVIDKINVNQKYSMAGVGVIFQIRLFDKPGYLLDPTTVCYDNATGSIITGSVASGTQVRCEHTFPMVGGSDSQTLRTRYSVSCVPNTSNPASASPSCAVPLTPAASSPGTIYTRTQLNGVKNTDGSWSVAPFVVPLAPFTVTGPDGSQVCTSVTVNPGGRAKSFSGWGGYSATAPSTSAPVCITVGAGGGGGATAAPLAYFLSGDVFAQGNIAGNAPFDAGGIIGTHGDYAVIANGEITNIGTRALASTATGADALAFASPAPLGDMKRPVAAKRALGTGTVINAATFNLNPSAASGSYLRTGNLRSQGTVGSPYDKQITIYVTGNLEIDGDIELSDAPVLAESLPYITFVVGGNIIIDDSVTRVDATLISHGTIYTCNRPKSSLSTSTCGNKLEINGPISGNDIALYRTKLTADKYTDAAEVVVYRPSLLVLPYLQQNSGILTTELEYELPPRY